MAVVNLYVFFSFLFLLLFSPYACVVSKLQALDYDILPWRKVPESDARSVCREVTGFTPKHSV